MNTWAEGSATKRSGMIGLAALAGCAPVTSAAPTSVPTARTARSAPARLRARRPCPMWIVVLTRDQIQSALCASVSVGWSCQVAGSPDGAASRVPSRTGLPKFGVPSAFQVNFCARVERSIAGTHRHGGSDVRGSSPYAASMRAGLVWERFRHGSGALSKQAIVSVVANIDKFCRIFDRTSGERINARPGKRIAGLSKCGQAQHSWLPCIQTW